MGCNCKNRKRETWSARQARMRTGRREAEEVAEPEPQTESTDSSK